mmetsp:Transcript_10709/g.34414  ORF Transcript_10709/g.34414 Transcript_10709/m.34414 type:complete len:308 (-) Transcript_10709:580-1503(-)
MQPLRRATAHPAPPGSPPARLHSSLRLPSSSSALMLGVSRTYVPSPASRMYISSASNSFPGAMPRAARAAFFTLKVSVASSAPCSGTDSTSAPAGGRSSRRKRGWACAGSSAWSAVNTARKSGAGAPGSCTTEAMPTRPSTPGRETPYTLAWAERSAAMVPSTASTSAVETFSPRYRNVSPILSTKKTNPRSSARSKSPVRNQASPRRATWRTRRRAVAARSVYPAKLREASRWSTLPRSSPASPGKHSTHSPSGRRSSSPPAAAASPCARRTSLTGYNGASSGEMKPTAPGSFSVLARLAFPSVEA